MAVPSLVGLFTGANGLPAGHSVEVTVKVNRENVKTAQSYQGVSRLQVRNRVLSISKAAAMRGRVYWGGTSTKHLATTGFCGKTCGKRQFGGF